MVKWRQNEKIHAPLSPALEYFNAATKRSVKKFNKIKRKMVRIGMKNVDIVWNQRENKTVMKKPVPTLIECVTSAESLQRDVKIE